MVMWLQFGLAFFLWSFSNGQPPPELAAGEIGITKCRPTNGSVHHFQVETLSGQNVSLSKYKELSQQYLDFNRLVTFYSQFGFYVLGFPCNQFNLEEQGENHEILNGIKYVRPGNGFVPAPNFHIYGKLQVNGDNAHELYKFLKNVCPPTSVKMAIRELMHWDVVRSNDLAWNFEKFIVDRNGKPLYRVYPSIWNNGEFVRPFIEAALSN